MSEEKRGTPSHGLTDELIFDPDLDPAPDPILSDLLREIGVPAREDRVSEESLELMRQSIILAAEGPLEQRRGVDSWWQYTAGWAGSAIPIGLAASIILALGLSLLSHPVSIAPTLEDGSTESGLLAIGPETSPESVLESMLAMVLGETEESILPSDSDDLLRAALSFEESDDR